jgi:hypothetical protein
MVTLTERVIDTYFSSEPQNPLSITRAPEYTNVAKNPIKKIRKTPNYHSQLEAYISQQIPENETSVTNELYDLAETLKGKKKGVRKNWYFRLKHAEEVIGSLEEKIKENLEQGIISSDYAANALEKAREMVDIATSSKYFKQNYGRVNIQGEVLAGIKKAESSVFRYNRLEDTINDDWENNTSDRVKKIQSGLWMNLENKDYTNYLEKKESVRGKFGRFKIKTGREIKKKLKNIFNYITSPAPEKLQFVRFSNR